MKNNSLKTCVYHIHYVYLPYQTKIAMDKKIRKNIDLKITTVKKLKLKAAKKDTNVKNYIESLVEKDVKE